MERVAPQPVPTSNPSLVEGTGPSASSSSSPYCRRTSSKPNAGGAQIKPERLSAVKLDDATIRRIIQKLNPNNSGRIQVKDIVDNEAFIQKECPILLESYGRLSKNGVVSCQDVRRLLLGILDVKPGSPGPGGQSPPKEPKMSEEALKRLFDQVKDSGADGVTVKSLVEHKEAVKSTFPALIDQFEKIDLDRDSVLTWEELKVFNGGTAQWLEHELSAIVGLESLKDQVKAFYRSIVLDQNRRKQGHQVGGLAKSPHMVFRGNPGTGKTSVARIMARLLHRSGLLSKPDLKEVQRTDLVAEHVGQTAPKTQAAIDAAKEGILFIDEAYRLTSTDSKNDFGREAVETLMAAMNEPPGKMPVMIFAGYVNDMASFMACNDGLYRRIVYTFDFPDYSCRDLAEILHRLVRGKGFRLPPQLLEADRSGLAALLEKHTTPSTRRMMNGGLCEHVFDLAKQQLDARDNPETPTIELSAEDLRAACKSIRPPEARPPAPASAAIVPGKGGPSVALPGVAPLPTALGTVGSQGAWRRNIWFHLEEGSGLKLSRGPCLPYASNCLVSIRLDRREVHRTPRYAIVDKSAKMGDTRILPYLGENLLEFVVFRCTTLRGPKFAASTTLALPALEAWDGSLELRFNDRPVGLLTLKVGWQDIAAESGGGPASCLPPVSPVS